MSIDNLIKNIISKKSPIVVGLDPRLEQIPDSIISKYEKDDYREAIKNIIFEFNKGIIDSIADIVPAVKPQVAFYEKYGISGMKAYSLTCEYAKKNDLYIIGDIKRGDIGSTSKAYSDGHIGKVFYKENLIEDFSVDSITVNPYLGDDCLKEFFQDIKEFDKSMFVLVKTSNKSSSQIQNLKVNDKHIYEIVAEMVNQWNEKLQGEMGYSPVGAVVGATYPNEMISLRKIMKKAYFLVPGYGAQGGSGKDVTNAFNKDGLGAVVNSSRGIIFAYEKSSLNYKDAARKAALDMIADINKELEACNKVYW
jgi:orotidine-5'-phosphate decarboxylase